MKKWIAFVLALAMSLCLLAGCGGGNEAPTEKPAASSAEKPAAQTGEAASKENSLSDGYWVVEKMVMDGTEFAGEDMTGIFGPADTIMAMAFDAAGSFNAVMFEDFAKGSYSGTPDALELDFAGEIVKGVCTDDTLVLTMKDGSFTLKRQKDMPKMLGENPWVTYAPDFDAAETIAMSNFMALGRYLIEDDVLYGLTHSRSNASNLAAIPFHMKGAFPEFEETALLDDQGSAYYICKDGESLYYIRDFEAVCRVKTDGSDAKVLYEGACDYLQLHEGRLYFTDADYCFVSTDLNGGDLQTVVDKEIYYPYFICSDWMVFQDDADDESLHLYNTTHGTELNITYIPSYHPILDGHYLYYTDTTEDGYFLCRIDMSDPDTFRFDGSELPLRESSFMIDDQSFYTTNGSSVEKADWKMLTDTSDTTAEIGMYVSEDYTVYHKLDGEGLISGKYVLCKEKSGASPFQ